MKAFNKGFTLIEMMIVVAIVGILAALAYPSYVDYLRRGAIPEGLAALSDGKVKMEQFFMDNRTYNNGGAGAGAVNACNSAPITGLSTVKFAVACVATANTFTLTATGNAGTLVDGFVYTINNANTKQTTGVHAKWVSSMPTLPRNCWVLKRDGSC